MYVQNEVKAGYSFMIFIYLFIYLFICLFIYYLLFIYLYLLVSLILAIKCNQIQLVQEDMILKS